MSEIEQPDSNIVSIEVTQLETRPLPVAQLSEEIEAIVAGRISLDITPTLTNNAITLAPGRLIEAGKATLTTTGSVANTGLALHKLGIGTSLMGKIGNDVFGQAILKTMRSYGLGLTTGMVVAPGEDTSYSIIISPPKTERVVIHAPGCNDTFNAADIRYKMLKSVALFHFGCPPLMTRLYQDNGAELARLLQQAKESGVTTSLDLSLPDPGWLTGKTDWRSILTASLPYVDVFLPTVKDLLLMLRRPLFDKLSSKAGKNSMLDLVTPDVVSELGRMLLDMGAKIVGLRAGHRGLYLCTANADTLERAGRAQPTKLVAWANRELWAPCFTTQVVGKNGSGDAVIAGVLMGLLRNMTPEATLSAACAVGACSVEAAEALSGIRSWPETLERIAAGWPRLMLSSKGKSPLDMPNFGWRWHESQEVWIGPMDVHH